MQDQLSQLKEATARLRAIGPVGLAVDIDGTLSPIAPTPEAAQVSPAARAALQGLLVGHHFAVVAIISGRAVSDAARLVATPGLFFLGNHGLEMQAPEDNEPRPVEATRPFIPKIKTVLSESERVLRGPNVEPPPWFEGLLFEDKGVTASIHYRLSSVPDLARQMILDSLAKLPQTQELIVREGRMVIELRPPVEVDKGTALVNLKHLYSLRRLIYIGDDLTDVDGFKAIRRLEADNTGKEYDFQGLAIGVQSQEMPPAVGQWADFLVEGVEGVAEYLTWLATTN